MVAHLYRGFNHGAAVLRGVLIARAQSVTRDILEGRRFMRESDASTGAPPLRYAQPPDPGPCVGQSCASMF